MADTTQPQPKKELGGETFPGLASYRQLKTHFPSARVKKLLQSDEDIGKVAQATPLVVGRAVELFMSALVEKTVEEASQGHSKKITVAMLKKVIEDNEEFDFVLDVCDKYSDSKDRDKDKEKDKEKDRDN